MDKQQRFARVILNGFYAYFAEFENITLAARTRFERAEWSSMQDISSPVSYTHLTLPTKA